MRLLVAGSLWQGAVAARRRKAAVQVSADESESKPVGLKERRAVDMQRDGEELPELRDEDEGLEEEVKARHQVSRSAVRATMSSS